MMAPDLNLRWQDQKVVKQDDKWTIDGRPVATTTLVFKQEPPNIPDHYYLGLKVTVPINSATPPHTHGGAAVVATMIKGRMLNQMVCPHHEPDSQGSGPLFFSEGESWYEPPGCHHVRSENVGDEEAVFIAWFVVGKEKFDKEGLASLVAYDAAEEEKRTQASK